MRRPSVLCVLLFVPVLVSCGTAPEVATAPSLAPASEPLVANSPSPAIEVATATAEATRTAETVTSTSMNKPTVEILKKDGYNITMACLGEGSPTVILDGKAHGGWDSWVRHNVNVTVAEFTRVCYYMRPDRPPALSSRQIVRDLREVLQQIGVGPPYVLVGTHFGGYTTRVFTADFPNEVAGLVLMNVFHPDENARFMAVIPPEQPDEDIRLKQLRTAIATDNKAYMLYGTAFDESAAQARTTGPFGDLPLLVVTAGKPSAPDILPQDVQEAWERERLAMQTEMTTLSTNSAHVIAEKSQIQVPEEEPEVAVDAIHTVVDAVRNGTPIKQPK